MAGSLRAAGRVTAVVLATCCAGLAALPADGQTPAPSPSATVLSAPPSASPQVWFGPLDPWSWDRFTPGSGPHQFDDLFEPGAPWQTVADRVAVFLLNNVWIDSFASDAELRTAVDALRSLHIGIWTEAGQLTETPTCNASTLEGFSGAEPARATLQRLRDAGGTLDAFGLEHGFDAATIYDLRCRMTPDDIARDTARTVAAVRSVFPDVAIGSVETANLDPELIATWLQAYRDATGEELGYFHLDPNYTIPDWAARAARIADVVRSRGIAFGITYAGDEADATDAAWLGHARARMLEYEVATGGSVDHAIFQSWHRHPARLLPETKRGTFTHLVAQYLRTRTSLTLVAGRGRAGGALMEAGGPPVAGATVTLVALPTRGDGLVADYRVTGTVPQGATRAVVGLRINTECDCSGRVAMRLDAVSYREGHGTRDLVPNGSFAGGFVGWGSWGTARARLVGRGAATGLEVRATARQDYGLDSGAFRVRPGARFRATFTARVGPASAGHGYFDVVFLGRDGEVRRFTLPLAPASITVGRDRTDGAGTYLDRATGPAARLLSADRGLRR
ncbi:MAG: hypothetical protein R3C32_01550 [Chloroflexota bacterium]